MSLPTFLRTKLILEIFFLFHKCLASSVHCKPLRIFYGIHWVIRRVLFVAVVAVAFVVVVLVFVRREGDKSFLSLDCGLIKRLKL